MKRRPVEGALPTKRAPASPPTSRPSPPPAHLRDPPGPSCRPELHRLSTFAAMDRLVVLGEGAVAGSGSHDEAPSRKRPVRRAVAAAVRWLPDRPWAARSQARAGRDSVRRRRDVIRGGGGPCMPRRATRSPKLEEARRAAAFNPLAECPRRRTTTDGAKRWRWGNFAEASSAALRSRGPAPGSRRRKCGCRRRGTGR